MTIHTPPRRLITAGFVISICVGLLTTPVVFAQRRGRPVLIQGLISRVHRQSREITLWEFRRGDSTWRLQVPGTTNMRNLQVGDFVQVEADSSRRIALRIRNLPPPEGDERYEEAVRRLEAETGKTQ
ncbi:MAG: hypothetical protein ACE5NA_08250 [Nitrospiraceae bacterium]